MPRIARAVAVGLPHHVTQRGNYGQDVFLCDADREAYLAWLADYAGRFGVKILAWCLMTNHVHFVAVPRREDSLARTFNATHMRHAHRMNRKSGLTGHLWQGRFFSCALGGRHLMTCARYIEQNPVRAGLAAEPWL